MTTFNEARAAATAATGQPMKATGFEGPDRYLVTPDVDVRDIIFNDSVLTVTKDTGEVFREVYVAAEMASWPPVRDSGLDTMGV